MAESRYAKKPSWIKVKAPIGENYLHIKETVEKQKFATVCQEARCPNLGECWAGGTATVMLMGEICTRGCRFCSVQTGKPAPLDDLEPFRVADSLSAVSDLDYIVLTSVDRDDLEDGGARHFAMTIQMIKERRPDMLVEVLTPDFFGREDLLKIVVDSEPDVFGHNMETVRRLTSRVRDKRAGYDLSLKVLKKIKEMAPERFTKTSLMLGLGETDEEIRQTLRDLREVGCDVVTFGQYLQPTKLKLKVEEFVTPEKFDQWREEAETMGFLYVASGPLVRSSYRAGEFFMKGMIRHGHAKAKQIVEQRNL